MSGGFSFGNTGSSGGLFGKSSAGTSSGTPATNNIFGATTSGAATTQPGGLFGGSSTPASAANPFGGLGATSGTAKPSIFGNTGSNPGSGTSTPTLFGASNGNASSGTTLFGSATNTGATTPSGSLFGGSNAAAQGSSALGGASGNSFSFGQKKEAPTTVTSNIGTPNKENTLSTGAPLGGGFGKPSGSLFGSATIPAPAVSTTPAKTSAFSFGTSTTPAGNPPADAAKTSAPSLFGSAQLATGGLFGGQKPPEATTNPPNAPSLFGASTGNGPSLFSGLNKPPTSDVVATSNTAAATPKPTFTFPSLGSTSAQPSTTNSAAPSPFGAVASTASANTVPPTSTTPSFFGGASSTAPANTIPPKAVTPSLFGAVGSKPTATSAAPAATPALFGNPVSTPSTSAPATSAPATSAPVTSAAAPSLFPSLGAASTAATSTASTTTAAAPTTSLFGPPKTTGATNGTTPATSVPDAGSAAATTATAGTARLGASSNAPSTTGPAPQLSRLKNKTMDEIITRWAGDLSTYQREFQDQAAKVSSWDRLLVENGDKIQKLYTSTFEAERASVEVERQLAIVESQQEELANNLSHYEAEVDKMLDERLGESVHQGPDQERERTYKLAEKLTDRLDDMSKDLTNMIQEINNASASLSTTSKTDDPLSHIVRVLNGHLSQLQWIDQNAAALQAKVAAAQKAGQSIGTSGKGPEGDAADDFYRSYMSRR